MLGGVGLFHVMSGGIRWCQMVLDGVEWCWMVLDGVRWCWMVSDGVRCGLQPSFSSSHTNIVLLLVKWPLNVIYIQT